MFNTIFSVTLPSPMQIGWYKVQHLAFKQNVGSSEIMFYDLNKKAHTMFVCELPTNVRELLNSIERN